MSYTLIGMGKKDTLASDMLAGSTTATLTSGAFGTVTGTQVLVVDYDVPNKRAAFKCTIAGTSLTDMVLIEGPDVLHSATAKVGMIFTPEHYRAIVEATEGVSAADGWGVIADTLSYASGSTINIPAGGLLKYSVGDKVKLDQSIPCTAYYPLDSSSVDTKGGFNGTDTAVTYTAGKFGNAATFNGTTSKIVIADNAALHLGAGNTPFTVKKWIKTSSTGAAKAIIVSKSVNPNYAGIGIFINSGNSILFESGNNTAVGASTVTGTSNVCDGNLHYVVITFQSSVGKVYVDGVLQSSGYLPAPVYAATNYVRIGCNNNSGADGIFMNGQIDDLTIINGFAEDATTIAANYARGTAQTNADETVTQYQYVTDKTDTLLTVTGGADYVLYNGAITNAYYSKSLSPVGFPQWFSHSAGSNMTIGNGVLERYFCLQGRTVLETTKLVFGSATAFNGEMNWTLPIAHNNDSMTGGTVHAFNTGVAYYAGLLRFSGTNTAAPIINGNSTSFTSTVPFTWTTGKTYSHNISYRI